MALARAKRTLITVSRRSAKGALGLLAFTLTLSLAISGPAPVALAASTSGAASGSALAPKARLQVSKWTYGPAAHGRQTATVFRNPSFKGRRPLVVLIHGGAWSTGSQASMKSEARVWARAGWVAVTMNYRLKVDGSQMVPDVRTVVEHYRRVDQVDRNKVVLYGSSAGGHLATLVGAQMGTPNIAGVVAWSPVASPYLQWRTGSSPKASAEDRALGRKAKKFFGYDWVRTSAVSYAKRKNAPRMFLAGSKDDHVRWSTQGGTLCKALTVKKCTRAWVSGNMHGMGLPRTQPVLAQAARDWAAKVVGAART